MRLFQCDARRKAGSIPGLPWRGPCCSPYLRRSIEGERLQAPPATFFSILFLPLYESERGARLRAQFRVAPLAEHIFFRRRPVAMPVTYLPR